jgi:tRNA nucleotidyltransferase (CCA-adding enzyme)
MGHIRTPLPPVQTFIDDPLRVLRVIRFASRFGFTLDSELHESCARGSQDHETIRTAFLSKISRERIGAEWDKMLRGPDPYRAIYLIVKDFGFYDLIFTEPAPELVQAPASGPRGVPLDALAENETDCDLALRISEMVFHALGSTSEANALLQILLPDYIMPLSVDDMRLLYFASVLVPFRGRTYLEKKKNVLPLSKYMVMTSLKVIIIAFSLSHRA